jgi:hypothetical protein
MTIFLESPWPILLIGIAAEAAMAVALLRSGRGKWLWPMLGVAVLVLGGLAVEHFVVTDRKLIIQTLDDATAGVEANDLQRVLRCISPSAARPRSDAQWLLGRVTFDTARIYRLDIKINRLTSPPSAKAHFTALGKGKDRSGVIPYQAYSRQVDVELQREGNRWLVTGYQVEGLNLPL